jgi:hypothetical protein
MSSSASNVVFPNTFAVSKISITQPKVLESGAKAAYLNYEGGKLVLQSAIAMSLPFGLSVYDKNPSGTPEYSIDLSFRGADKNPEIKLFQDRLQDLDAYMIDQGVKNCKSWFKSDLKREVIQAFYTPTVRFAKDKEGNLQPYPPTLKIKLRKPNGDFEAKFYDVKGNAYKGVPVEDLLAKGVQLTALIECGGVWFAGSKFGLTFRAKQIIIHKLPERLADFAFRLPSSVVEADTGSALAPRDATASASAAADEIEDNEEEEDNENEVDDDEDAALTAPPPVVAKPSVLAAVLPPPPAPVAQEVDAAPVPKRTIIKKKPTVSTRPA